MNGKQLRNSILQWAISGRLVPQDPNDEPAIELLKRINPKAAPITEDVPFSLPDSWCWVRLGDICSSITDGTHSTPKYTSSGIPFVSVKDMSSGTLDLTKTKYISQDEHDILSKRCNPQKGDILLSKVGTTGIPVLVTTERAFSLFVSVALIKFDSEKIDKNFLVYLIKSPLVQEQAKENTRGVGNKNWVLSAIADTLVVLPPLAEQERIVRKVEELLPLVERYDKAQTELDRLNASLKGKLRASVLQEAISGRFVPQDPNDEPAIELLKRINPKAAPITEDVPFSLPDSWCWTTLGEIGKWQSGSTPSRTRSDYYGGNIPWLKTGDLNDGLIEKIPENITQKALEETSVKLNPAGSVLIAMYGATVGKVGILTFPATTNQACCACSQYKVEQMYLFYFLLANRANFIAKGVGGAQPNISKEKIVATPFPLPPLAEQERIVQKVEELFAVLDALQ